MSFAESFFTHGGSPIMYATQKEKIVVLIFPVPDVDYVPGKFGAILYTLIFLESCWGVPWWRIYN